MSEQQRGGRPGPATTPDAGRSLFRDGGAAPTRSAADEGDVPTVQQPAARSQATPPRAGAALRPGTAEQPASPVAPRAVGTPAGPESSAASDGSANRPSAEPAGPTLAERIMNRLPPPPQKQAAWAAAAGAAASTGAAVGRPGDGEAPGPDRQETRMTQPTPAGARPPVGPPRSATTAFRTSPPAAATRGGQASVGAPATGTSGVSTATPVSAASGDSASRSGVETHTFPVGPPSTRSGGSRSGDDDRPMPRRTRKARLRLSKVDPWSVMKTFFLFSIAGGIAVCVAVGVVFTVIETSGLFDSLDQMVSDILGQPGDDTPFQVREYLNFNRVMGVTALLACVDVLIFTALATVGSFLYNLSAQMLGGLEVTLAED